MKAQHGYFTERRPCPENLTDEGWYWYKVMLTKFEIENVNFKYSLERSVSIHMVMEKILIILGFE